MCTVMLLLPLLEVVAQVAEGCSHDYARLVVGEGGASNKLLKI